MTINFILMKQKQYLSPHVLPYDPEITRSYLRVLICRIGRGVPIPNGCTIVSGAGSVDNRAHLDTSNTLCGTAYWYGLFAKCMLANQKMPYFQDGGPKFKMAAKIYHNAQEVLNIVFYRPNVANLLQNINCVLFR